MVSIELLKPVLMLCVRDHRPWLLCIGSLAESLGPQTTCGLQLQLQAEGPLTSLEHPSVLKRKLHKVRFNYV